MHIPQKWAPAGLHHTSRESLTFRTGVCGGRGYGDGGARAWPAGTRKNPEPTHQNQRAWEPGAPLPDSSPTLALAGANFALFAPLLTSFPRRSLTEHLLCAARHRGACLSVASAPQPAVRSSPSLCGWEDRLGVLFKRPARMSQSEFSNQLSPTVQFGGAGVEVEACRRLKVLHLRPPVKLWHAQWARASS